MLTVNATNFGVSPDDMQIKSFQSDNLLILDGSFTVDTANAEYRSVHYLKLTVPDLPFSKSRETTAFAMIDVDGVRHITLVKCKITDRNTIRLSKILAYSSAGSYTVRLCSAFIPVNIAGAVALQTKSVFALTATAGALTDAECFGAEADGWMMLAFRAEGITFDSDGGGLKVTLDGFPSGLSFDLPLIYNESLTDKLGSKFVPASVSDGVLSVSADDAPESVTKVGYFFSRMFIVK